MPLQPDLEKVVFAELKARPELKKGDLVTINEPGLTGFKVCAGDICTTTDADGNFSLATPNQNPTITITDPTTGTVSREMRYFNLWQEALVRSAFTRTFDSGTMSVIYLWLACDKDATAQVCKQDATTVQVREQQLNDALLKLFSRSLDTSTLKTDASGKPLPIGLTQGILTSPIRSEDYKKISGISQHYDHDPAANSVLMWDGTTAICYTGRTCSIHTADGHVATDIDVPQGTIIVASMPATIFNISSWESEWGTGLRAAMENAKIPLPGIDTPYYHPGVSELHLIDYIVNLGDTPYRGEITDMSGQSGTSWPHLHFAYWIRGRTTSSLREIDPWGVLYPTTDTKIVYSSWTAFNMVFLGK